MQFCLTDGVCCAGYVIQLVLQQIVSDPQLEPVLSTSLAEILIFPLERAVMQSLIPVNSLSHVSISLITQGLLACASICWIQIYHQSFSLNVYPNV